MADRLPDFVENFSWLEVKDHTFEYAKEIGFDRTYIPTEFVGLYENMFITIFKDIVNYGNGIVRLYAKEAK